MLNYIVTKLKYLAVIGNTESKYSHIYLHKVMLVIAYLCIENFPYLSLLDGINIQLQEEILVLFIRIRKVWVW